MSSWMPHLAPENRGPFAGEHAAPLARYYRVLQNIRRMRLVFNGDNPTKEDYEEGYNRYHFITDTFADGVVVEWLKHCPNVQNLDVVLPVAPSLDLRAGLKHVLGDLHFRSLVVLQVSNFQAKPDDVTQVLLRHKDTLQELQFEAAHLKGGDWPACLVTFAGRLPHLRRARLGGGCTSARDDGDNEDRVACFLTYSQARRHEAEIEQYILTGKGPIPEITRLHSEFEVDGDNSWDEEEEDYEVPGEEDALEEKDEGWNESEFAAEFTDDDGNAHIGSRAWPIEGDAWSGNASSESANRTKNENSDEEQPADEDRSDSIDSVSSSDECLNFLPLDTGGLWIP